MRKPLARDLRMDNKIGQQRYNNEVKKFYIRHKIEERMNKLIANIQFPCTTEHAKEWEEIDALRMKAQRKGLEKCCKIYVRGIASHPKIKRIRLRNHLIEMIQERQKGGTSIRW
eukprot:13527132-Ditylum_brightwellii.AAC.1